MGRHEKRPERQVYTSEELTRMQQEGRAADEKAILDQQQAAEKERLATVEAELRAKRVLPSDDTPS